MEGFDDAGVFFSDNFSETESSQATNNQALKKQLTEFIRTFQEGNFAYKYRDALKSNYLRSADSLSSLR
jgi:DNA replication licensing factor MCM5